MVFVLILDTQTHTKERVRRMLEAACRALGHALGLPQEQVRVLYQPGKPAHYWEGGAGDVPTQSRPVFVTVQTPEAVEAAKARTLFAELSSAVGGALNILPERVHIRIEEGKPGLTAEGPKSIS